MSTDQAITAVEEIEIGEVMEEDLAPVVATRMPAVVSVDPQALLAQAIEKNLPLEAIERLLAMRRELKGEWARERFFADLSRFQGACPIIGKSKIVKDKNNKDRYRYAPLDEIVGEVRKPLAECGFSYTIVTKQTKESVTAICAVHHVDGHSESSEFTIPVDPDAYMNDAQKAASAMSYAKRYAFVNALGIMTGDPDDDGENGGRHSEDKSELRAPQAVAPKAAEKPAASLPPATGAYAEIMQHILAKERSAEGPMVALFSNAERTEWKHKADAGRGNPDQLVGILQELDEISEQRRAKIKEGS